MRGHAVEERSRPIEERAQELRAAILDREGIARHFPVAGGKVASSSLNEIRRSMPAEKVSLCHLGGLGADHERVLITKERGRSIGRFGREVQEMFGGVVASEAQGVGVVGLWWQGVKSEAPIGADLTPLRGVLCRKARTEGDHALCGLWMQTVEQNRAMGCSVVPEARGLLCLLDRVSIGACGVFVRRVEIEAKSGEAIASLKEGDGSVVGLEGCGERGGVGRKGGAWCADLACEGKAQAAQTKMTDALLAGILESEWRRTSERARVKARRRVKRQGFLG